MKLLLVVTDVRFVETVRSWMGMNGSTVDWIVLGAQAERTLSDGRYDAMLLELGLPDMPATEVLRRLRSAGQDLPLVIVANAEGSRVALTEKEYSLLEALLRNKGVVVSRQRLEQIMNGHDGELASKPVEVHVHHLRRKLGARLITTVRGVGYTLGQEA